tara:strand:+ start:3083 stop:3520 length:438 start_codon:yes stop_codon:yes gene_type:complete
MTYGLAIRTSSGLTELDDVYTVREKEEHSLDSGGNTYTLNQNVDFEYGTFTALGIDFDETTDAYFLKDFKLIKNAGQVYSDHWADHFFYAFYGINMPNGFALDTTANKAILRVHDLFWTTTGISTNYSTDVLFHAELTIVKIKAS